MINSKTEFESILKNRVKDTINELENAGYDKQTVRISFNNPQKIKWKPRSHFVKLYSNELADIVLKYNLDTYSLAAILKLLPYVEYETNLIADDNGNYLSKKMIQRVLNYSEIKVNETLNLLIDKKILASTKVGRELKFHMNPELAFRGIFLSPDTESIFRNKR